MREMFLDRSGWVLSGALDGWGDPIIPFFDLVIFVHAPSRIRLKRLRDREARLFGADAVSPRGWRHRGTEEFIEWASLYDDGGEEVRSLTRHRAWLAALSCPVLQVDGTRPAGDVVHEAVAALSR
jgi:hypothetical protein